MFVLVVHENLCGAISMKCMTLFQLKWLCTLARKFNLYQNPLLN